MKYLKHNIILNFKESPSKEKAQILVDEMSKAYMLYPKATADILDSCNIKYRSLHPSELSNVVKNNSDNLKMLNRIIKLTFLVNKDGTVDMSRQQFFASVVDAFLEDKRARQTRKFQYLGVAENLTSPFQLVWSM